MDHAVPLGNRVVPDNDSVLDVLTRELMRSMSGLAVPGSPRPYYMSYSLRRIHELRLRAAYGSLVRSREGVHAHVYADVRVGSHKFDNFIDGGLSRKAEERESSEWLEAPDDLDPTALQVTLWKLTQIKFDEALQDYYDHRKALVSEYLRDETDSLSREQRVVYTEQLRHDPFPRARWESCLQTLSRRFIDHADVYDPTIGLRAERVHRWLVNSEGTQVVTEDVYVEIDVSGWVLTDDGVYVEAARQGYFRAVDEVPDSEGLGSAIDEVLAELAALRNADSPGAFLGPALLAGQAASTLFHEALGHRLEGERLVARGETRTFAHKLGERILPPGLHIYDDPTMARFRDQTVWGSYRIDDQGVPARRAMLVEDGKLAGFLQSRSPIPGGTISNGHGRHDGVEAPMARMGNLVAEGDPARSRSFAELEHELIALARAQGRRYAAVIKRIHGGETTTNSYDFQVFKGEPSEVYLLDVETGARKRIRDVEIIGTPLSAMQRIVAFGGEPELDQGFCFAESGSIPVSGIAPAVLVSELEMQQRSTAGYHEPLLPPPFADDGSRGRSGNLRTRGRRRRPNAS